MMKFTIRQVSAYICQASYVVSDGSMILQAHSAIPNECSTLEQLYSEQLKTALPTACKVEQVIEFYSSCSAGEKGRGNDRKRKPKMKHFYYLLHL
jgi:uncharacterized protein